MILPRDDILRVYILTENGYYASKKTPYDMERLSDFAGADWYIQALQTPSQIILPVHSERVFGAGGTQIFSIVQSLRSKEDSDRVLGVMKVDANYKGIQAICGQVVLGPESALVIVDSSHNVIYSSGIALDDSFYEVACNAAIPETKGIGDKEYLFNAYALDAVDWTIAAIHDKRALEAYSRQTRNESFIFAAALLLGLLALFYFFITKLMKPFFQIVALMQTVQKGDLSVRANVQSHDEFGYLGHSFNGMLETIETTNAANARLASEVFESRYLQKEAQYNALCSQIRPHFLYNALNTISLQVKSGYGDSAVEDIDRLSTLLRGVMHTDREIELSDELRIVRAYLSLLQSRFGDRLQFTIDVDPKWLDLVLPALSIQPLVENAVEHGAERKRGTSVIHVQALEDGNDLIILVENNGPGIPPEKLKEIRQKLADGYSHAESGIGLVNANRRIQLKYGLDYGLDIESDSQQGVRCSLRLPATRKG
jgi:two-component system sensor histidine kinase YesM